MKKTRKAYEQYLNGSSPEQGDERWIIGGVIRMLYMWKRQYGTALRKYDPTQFNVGFNEWQPEKRTIKYL